MVELILVPVVVGEELVECSATLCREDLSGDARGGLAGIEDWHKVLKTGCEIEERQFQTWERMEVLLSVYSVIAWKVLELRKLARGEGLAAPETLLSDAERAVLETKFPELSGQSVKSYAVHVAKLGGYLDRGSDPPPGWETMWKGLQKLRMWAEGHELGAE